MQNSTEADQTPRFPMPPLLWGTDSLHAAAAGPTGWLWHGFLAAGAVTLLTSQWKAGKTTLTSILLARLKTGGLLAGAAVAAGKAIVLSEEGPEHWKRRSQQLDFGDHVGWYCRPFRGKPSQAQWCAFIDGLLDVQERQPFSLLVIDPLAAFLPGSENHASTILAALLPLQRLTAQGVSVLVLHHPRKGDPPLGQAARGSGALAGYVDVLIEMRSPQPDSTQERERRLWSWSRFPETPTRLVIEWSADGTDYTCFGSFQEEDFKRHWTILQSLFATADRKLTRKQLLEAWPNDQPPDKGSLGRWLESAVSQGLLHKSGQGLRDRPYEYWTPERQAEWQQDPMSYIMMPELFGWPPPLS